MLYLLALFIILPKIPYIFWKTYKNTWNNDEEITLTWIQRVVFIGISDFLKIWHNYDIHDLEKIKSYSKNGNVLLVGYHSRCTLDLVYLISTIQCNVLASYILFKIPFINYLMKYHFNVISSTISRNIDNNNNSSSSRGSSNVTDDQFVTTLYNSKKPLLLLPGGIFEFFKEYKLRYHIQWKEIPGFVRVICNNPTYLGNNTKVIPFYTKKCENCYYHHELFYNNFGKFGNYCYNYCKKGSYYIVLLPFTISIILLSFGFFLLPRRIKLDTYFGEPLQLNQNETAQSFAKRIKIATQELIDKIEFDEISSSGSGSSSSLIHSGSNDDYSNSTWSSNDQEDDNDDISNDRDQDDNKITHAPHTSSINHHHHFEIKMIFYYTKIVLLGLYTFIQNTIVLIILLFLIWLPFPLLLLYAMYQVINDYSKVILKHDNNYKA